MTLAWIVALPFVGTATCDPPTVVCDGGNVVVVLVCGYAGNGLDGALSTAWRFIAVSRAVFIFTRTARLPSSDPLRDQKAIKRKTSKTPRTATTPIAQVGVPSRRGLAVTIFLSTIGVAFIGRPQFGHATAELDISCPHSGQ